MRIEKQKLVRDLIERINALPDICEEGSHYNEVSLKRFELQFMVLMLNYMERIAGGNCDV